MYKQECSTFEADYQESSCSMKSGDTNSSLSTYGLEALFKEKPQRKRSACVKNLHRTSEWVLIVNMALFPHLGNIEIDGQNLQDKVQALLSPSALDPEGNSSKTDDYDDEDDDSDGEESSSSAGEDSELLKLREMTLDVARRVAALNGFMRENIWSRVQSLDSVEPDETDASDVQSDLGDDGEESNTNDASLKEEESNEIIPSYFFCGEVEYEDADYNGASVDDVELHEGETGGNQDDRCEIPPHFFEEDENAYEQESNNDNGPVFADSSDDEEGERENAEVLSEVGSEVLYFFEDEEEWEEEWEIDWNSNDDSGYFTDYSSDHEDDLELEPHWEAGNNHWQVGDPNDEGPHNSSVNDVDDDEGSNNEEMDTSDDYSYDYSHDEQQSELVGKNTTTTNMQRRGGRRRLQQFLKGLRNVFRQCIPRRRGARN